MALSSRARRRVGILLAGFVVLAIAAPAAHVAVKAKRQQRIAEALELGLAAYSEQRYPETMEHLGFYVGRVHTNGEAYFALADARYHVESEDGRYLKTALALATQASDLMPDQIEPLDLRLELYVKLGFATEAIEVATRIIGIDQSHRRAHEVKIGGLAALGRLDEAMGVAEDLVAQFPDDVEAHRAILDIRRGLGHDMQELLAYADDLAAKHENEVGFVLLKAAWHEHAGDNDGAQAAVRQAAQIGTDDPLVLRRIVALMDTLGLQREAEEALAAAAADPETGLDAAIVAAERAWKDARVADAVEQVKALPTDFSAASSQTVGWMGFLLSEAGEPNEFVLDELEQRNDVESSTWLGIIKGAADLRAGNLEEARSRLEMAVRQDTGNTLASFLLGTVENSLGEWRRAEARWRPLLRQQRWLGVNIALVRLLLERGQVEAAHREAAIAFAGSSDRLDSAALIARTSVAMIEAGLGSDADVVSTLDLLEQIAAQAPEPGFALAMLARVHLATGQEEAAGKDIANLIAQESRTQSDVMRALLSSLDRHRIDARQDLEEWLISGGVTDPEILMALAKSAAQAGRADQGKQMIRNAIAAATSDAQRADYEDRLAALLHEIGDEAGFESLVEHAQQNPQSVYAQLSLLNSEDAWSREAVVTDAISRLRDLTGDSASGWRLFEARRLLTFNSSEARAAEAENLLRELLRFDPDHAEALVLAAEAAMSHRDGSAAASARTDAIKDLEQAVNGSPEEAWIYPRLIQLLQAAGRSSEAETWLRRFGRFGNLSVELKRRRALLFETQGLWDDAAGDLSQLADELGQTPDRLALARVLERSGDVSGARGIYEQLLAASEVADTSRVQAADFFANRGDIERGLKTLESLGDLTAVQAILVRAGFLERHGRLGEAEVLFRSATAESESSEPWVELARFLAGVKRYADAREALDRARELDPQSERIDAIDGLISLYESDRVTSENLTKLVGSIASDESRAVMEKLVRLIQGIEQDPENAQPFIDGLRGLRRQSPTFYPAAHLLVSAYLNQGKPQEAVDAARDAARTMPANPDASRLAAETLLATGHLDEALGAARAWLRLNPSQAYEAQMVIGIGLANMGRHREALATVEPWRDRILEEVEAVPGRLEMYTTLLVRLGQTDQAHSLLWPRAQETLPWALAYTRVARQIRSDPETLVQWLERIEPFLADDDFGTLLLAQGWLDLALQTRQDAHFERVVRTAQTLVERPDWRAAALMIIATSQDQSGRYAQAEASYRQLLDVVPDHATALNNLAYMLIQAKGSTDEAISLATRAVDLGRRGGMDPSIQVNFADTLGVALLHSERFDEAETVFVEALDLRPRQLNLLVGLAEAQKGQGQNGAMSRSMVLIEDVLAASAKPQGRLWERVEALRAAAAGQG